MKYGKGGERELRKYGEVGYMDIMERVGRLIKSTY